MGAALPERSRLLVAVLYPGDTITGSDLPPLDGIAVAATTTSTLARLAQTNSNARSYPGIAASDVPALDRQRQSARAALHIAALGRLTAAERLATLLIEQSLVLGRATPSGFAFDSPLSREDIADYLALNPDTLSRLMSQMKNSRVIAMASRRKVIVRDFDQLCAASPLAGALKALYRR